jgi:hypothetical protein
VGQENIVVERVLEADVPGPVERLGIEGAAVLFLFVRDPVDPALAEVLSGGLARGKQRGERGDNGKADDAKFANRARSLNKNAPFSTRRGCVAPPVERWSGSTKL